MASITSIYDLGQEVFYMHENRCKSGIVGRIKMEIHLESGDPAKRGNFIIKIKYGLFVGDLVPSGTSFYEYDLFKSKEHLLKSL